VREYVLDDLSQLAAYLGLEILELRGEHRLVEYRRPPKYLRAAYRALTRMFPGLRDSLLLVARKPAAWTPPERDPDEVYEQIVPSTLLSPGPATERR
jgi:hypothetical protein